MTLISPLISISPALFGVAEWTLNYGANHLVTATCGAGAKSTADRNL